MDWKINAIKKYKKGIKNLTIESNFFVELLNKFNKKNDLKRELELKHYDLMPEGGLWLLLLINNKEILVERCMYRVENKDIDYVWVDFNMKTKQVIVEVNKKDGTSTEYILIPSDEIINHIP